MFAFTFAFLVVPAFLRVAVVTGVTCRTLLHLVSSSLSPNVQFCPVLARVDVCRARVGRVGRLGRAISFLDLVCLPLPFTLPFLRDSACIRSSSALVPFPADTVGFAPNFREE